MNKNLLIGGAGFIGSHIAEILLKKKEQVLIIDNFSRGLAENLNLFKKNRNLKIKKLDINNFSKLKKYLKNYNKIFLLAALRITQTDNEIDKAFKTMGVTYFKIFNYIKNFKNKTIIYSSSASIYGQANFFPTTEIHHPYNNKTFYGVLKLLSENMLNYFFHNSKNNNFICLRYFNVIGPKMDSHGKYTEVIVRWFKELQTRNTISIHGDGNQMLDFVDVRDIAKINYLFSRKKFSGTFNVCSCKGTTLLQLAQLIKKITKKKSAKFKFIKTRKINDLKKRLGCNKKVKTALKYNFNYDLKETIQDTYNFWKLNQ
jgi:UDP-glucose 4-epimerase